MAVSYYEGGKHLAFIFTSHSPELCALCVLSFNECLKARQHYSGDTGLG